MTYMTHELHTIRTTKKNRANARDAKTFVAKMAGNPSTIRRKIGADEATAMLELLNDHPEAIRVRVYSFAGFVPNSYGHPCPIQWIEADRTETGWLVGMGSGDAKRSRGNGPLATVNGRAVR
jgi:hypothetical protein